MYWWPGMHTSICENVRCCQQDKNLQRQPAGKLIPLPVLEASWDSVTVDRITNLPITKPGFTGILVVVDRLTKLTRFMPCKNESMRMT